jgi:acetyltransferase-like isoleucine patch superfamily enzyme
MGSLRFLSRRFILWAVNATAGAPSARLNHRFRSALLGLLGCRFGENSQISEEFFIYRGSNLTTGTNCRIGAFAKIWDFAPITIGDSLLASHNLVLISATHGKDSARGEQSGPISIGNNVWVGVNVTIIGPVDVGDGAVIGANSLVLSDVPSFAVVGGVPAKVIGKAEG